MHKVAMCAGLLQHPVPSPAVSRREELSRALGRMAGNVILLVLKAAVGTVLG